MNHRSTTDAKDLLVADFKRVMFDAEALLKAVAVDGNSELDEVRARIEESLARARTRLDDAQTALRATGEEAATAAHVFVKGNPWLVVGMAAGLGVLLGLVSGRRWER